MNSGVCACRPRAGVRGSRSWRRSFLNAIALSGPDAPVEVRAARDGSTIAIHVLDRGPSVPAEQRQRMFDRRSSGECTMTRLHRGPHRLAAEEPRWAGRDGLERT